MNHKETPRDEGTGGGKFALFVVAAVVNVAALVADNVEKGAETFVDVPMCVAEDPESDMFETFPVSGFTEKEGTAEFVAPHGHPGVKFG
ncbi:hypothetical protein UCRPC4_g03074 [Phaeomoniella chlamydospora]|uniref:Uncharacterized protein n=1 Tax=Phaeomoniella chlamydospora TaxID=158046 RepID=A0A0G2EK65_PHACM|nr:hypothetical protein UCRPC4_g03074 [Phaeomoniella chlamydospora]